MDGKEKEQLKKKIEEAIVLTARKIEELEELPRPIGPENAIGRVSRMDAIHNRSVAEATLRSTKRKYGSLKVALQRIDHPDFGSCSRCGQNIPAARLMYLPESTRCVRCADR